MNDIAIRVENLSKRYQIGAKQEPYRTLRDTLAGAASAPFRRVRAALQRPDAAASARANEFWALKDVSFEVKRGEVVGIIGRNGAGKSTLLKILSRITEPSSGHADIYGRVGSLLEVGTGFHPELTGRENIYLNGAILGMKRAEIDRQFDAIVEFAEVEKFVDTAVKHYSSGMYLRLAFAVAAHLDPEILLVDEVLAVGDAAFQKKCLGKMGEVAKQGRTVFFVSHNMAAINVLCTSAIVLSQGQIACRDTTSECINMYNRMGQKETTGLWLSSKDDKHSPLSVTRIEAAVYGEQPNMLLDIDVSLTSHDVHKPAFIAFDILANAGVSIMQSIPNLTGFIDDGSDTHRFRVSIQLPPLIPGRYWLSVWVGSHNTETLDRIDEAVSFEVFESPSVGRSFPHSTEHGYIVPKSSLVAL